jgi:hypothetical protein
MAWHVSVGIPLQSIRSRPLPDAIPWSWKDAKSGTASGNGIERINKNGAQRKKPQPQEKGGRGPSRFSRIASMIKCFGSFPSPFRFG